MNNYIYASLVLYAISIAIQNYDLARSSQLFKFDILFSNFKQPNFLKIVLLIRTLGLFLIFSKYSVIALSIICLSNFYLSFKFYGTTNGGSDYVTNIHGLCLILICTPFTILQKVGLHYLSIQMILSYFIAGITKLKCKEWRTGQAIELVLSDTIYKNIKFNIVKLKLPLQIMTIATLAFELLIPFSFFNHQVLLCFLVLALLFHLTINFSIGLNRFFFAWIATFPLLMFFQYSLNI